MGALRHVTPTNLDQFGRDPQSPSERLRTKTNYSKGTGYAPMFHAMVADLKRVTRGASCTHLILAIQAFQDRTAGEGWTESKSLADWADLAGCDEKEIQRNRDYLKLRKMSDCKVDTKRLYSFRLRPENWQALEDYKVWFAKNAPKDEPTEETPNDAVDEATKAGNWRMSKPVSVGRGKTSKAFQPDCGVARIRFRTPAETPDGVDIAYFGVVQAGDLIITPTVTLQAGVQKAKSAATKTTSHDSRGHGRPPERAKVERKSLTVDHPRASELVKLFDPILGKSQAVLLADAPDALITACAAIADCDHNHLVGFVGKRASSPINKPSHVAIICREALASWKASKLLDASGAKHYSREEIDEMVKQERAELARKREELRRRK